MQANNTMQVKELKDNPEAISFFGHKVLKGCNDETIETEAQLSQVEHRKAWTTNLKRLKFSWFIK